MSAELDEHVLSTLSEEERQALAEHAEDIKAMQAEEAAGGDDGDEDPAPAPAPAAEAPEAGAADPAPAPAAEAPAPAPEPAAAPEASPVDVDEPEDAQAIYKVELPEDFDAQLQAAKAKESEAWQAFEDGSIDRVELQQRLNEANAEAQRLNNLQVKAEVAREMQQQAEAKAAQKAALVIIKQGKEQGIDYTADDAKWQDLRAFADQVERRNPGKPVDWVLAEAHKRVLALYGVSASTPPAPPPPPPPPAPKPADAKKAALEARKPDLSGAPRDLSQVPGGEGPGDVSAEFSDILALEGDAYEAALARMTPAQRDRFMQVV